MRGGNYVYFIDRNLQDCNMVRERRRMGWRERKRRGGRKERKGGKEGGNYVYFIDRNLHGCIW